ncbi:two-component response regulator-like APRR3 isoform X2 [Eutrema salsugineum]|uniref:two-component response regulator-like APRR3 isoform X2 n=1 Tax=Eutrema salsugineum TaxID=72664 RepID=UPI000CED10BA|nr:two-component response regulator-like APRR3 isoform X2 [Eutrema salsugineum]
MCFNNNEVANEVETERQTFGEDESRVQDIAGNANNLLQQQQQQQPLAPVVKWERYLPVRSLKVLLVENDDSTRHIVTALLKNCSYEVSAVSDVLEAWRILEDENSCIDLVLSEVVMPVNSGTGLLCKIMSHKTLKNIPVIMMSSHDSMVLVFKCLSNGAVDFLVKPIRKNELKNLWQHVWRKCHSSSGSGSESRIQNKKSAKTESTEGSEDDASMSDEDHGNDNGSIGLSNGDGGSDNGSGTQSSWTKRASDIKSTSPSYQLPDAPNMNLGTYGNRWERFNELKEVENQNEQRGMGLQAGMCMSTKAEEPGSLEKDAKYSIQALERNNSDMQNCSSGNSQVESKTPSSNPEDLKGLDLKSLKITLTKPREAGTYRMGDRSVLRHSNHSAFSKYNNGATSANKAPEENVGSCSPHDSSIAKIMCSGSSSDNPLNQQSSGSDRAAQREAALMKFRLKRKERCFEKKVRYYSRKKLAEQRPRVKGQFIRKSDESKSGNECPSSDDS